MKKEQYFPVYKHADNVMMIYIMINIWATENRIPSLTLSSLGKHL